MAVGLPVKFVKLTNADRIKLCGGMLANKMQCTRAGEYNGIDSDGNYIDQFCLRHIRVYAQGVAIDPDASEIVLAEAPSSATDTLPGDRVDEVVNSKPESTGELDTKTGEGAVDNGDGKSTS